MPSFYDRRNVDDNWIGSRRDDVMSGNGGNDTMDGMGGNDRMYGGTGNDRMFGGDGNDYLQGNDGNDVLAGGNGADGLASASGVDHLWGGNYLNGGGDGAADTFVFNNQADSTTVNGVDTIHDFHPEEGDRINIGRTMEAYAYSPSYAVELVSSPSLLTHDHQQATLTYDSASNLTILNLYFADNDPDIDMILAIVGNHTTSYGFMDFYPGG